MGPSQTKAHAGYILQNGNVYQPANTTNGIPNQTLDLLPTITKVARNYGLDSRLIVSIIKADSFGYRYAVGPIGELGLMQINISDPNLKLSKAQYGKIFDPETNISIGASILKANMQIFNGNVIKVAEAYNSGAGRVLSGSVPKSTRTYYVGTVLECMREMGEPSEPRAKIKDQPFAILPLSQITHICMPLS